MPVMRVELGGREISDQINLNVNSKSSYKRKLVSLIKLDIKPGETKTYQLVEFLDDYPTGIPKYKQKSLVKNRTLFIKPPTELDAVTV